MNSAAIDDLPITQAANATPLWFIAPTTALLYPLPLKVFHAAVTRIDAGAGFAAWAAAAVALLLAFAAPAIAMAACVRLSAIVLPTAAELVARRVAMLAVAAPPMFTLVGVGFLLLGASSLDAPALGLWWLATIVWIARADRRTRAKLPEASPGDAKLRVAHGAVAVVVIVYLAFHFSNHMFAWIGPEAHMAVMKLFRGVYRSSWGEPILLLAFLFMMLSGGRMAWRLTARRADGFRTFQIASGVYLIFAVISHLNAVLYLARVHFGIDTDWAFAMGAPTGMLRDAWNIRLVPYYFLAVAFVIAHPFSGMRVVMLAHGAAKPLADGVVRWGTAFGAFVSLLIMLAMCGVRVHLG